MHPVRMSRARIERYVVSPWNHWQMPAPMMIIERPWDSSAFAANSRAMRMHCSAATPVISACHAGV